MFATLRAPSCPVTALTAVAQDFTPRFEVVGEIVVLDVSGLARLFGGPAEIGDYLYRALSTCASDARVATAPTATAAMLLVLGRTGLSVVTSSEMMAALAALPLSVLGAYERICTARAEPDLMRQDRAHGGDPAEGRSPGGASALRPAQGAPSLSRGGGGWQHPRYTHQAGHLRRSLRPIVSSAARRAKIDAIDVQATLDLLERWGLTTLGALTALPTADVSERLGARGTRWQHLARGEDERPLVPWVPEEPFEVSLALEWPLEGLEPLSFVLTRLLDPLADRLARADRGAAIVHTRLRLVDKTMYARQVQLPAPMRDPKTLRTLMLLDLESHPPTAAVDRVGVLIEPTPGRVLQWTLFERAQPSPEQVSTLLARLTALMGEGHVGSPALADSWKPGAFELKAFQVLSAGVLGAACGAEGRVQSAAPHSMQHSLPHSTQHAAPHAALCALHRTQHPAPSTLHSSVMRRFRLPVPARVRVHEGRPVRVQVDRRGLASGAVVQAAGPWRTSGQWWQASQCANEGIQESRNGERRERANERHSSIPPFPHSSILPIVHSRNASSWDRDEWDILLGDGTIYRLFVEREIGQWFIEGVID